MAGVEFTVPFAHGLQRARTGNGRFYDTTRNKMDKLEIQAAFKSALVCQKCRFFAAKGTPVRLKIEVYTPLAQSAPKDTVSMPHVKKPDLDNVVKLVLDALNGVAWDDDQQVNCIFAKKLERRRCGKPYTRIRAEYQEKEERNV